MRNSGRELNDDDEENFKNPLRSCVAVRAFSLIALLVTILIVGWFAASYISNISSGNRGLASPSASGTSDAAQGESPLSPVDRARGLVSMDEARQRQMQELLQ